MGKALSRSFSKEDKNKLKDEAKMQAPSMADELIKRLSSEIEKSARKNMEMLAKSFGAKSVVLDFSKSQPLVKGITDASEHHAAAA
jgi:F0F1-type ATP synthase membrane subunit b/b'